jgi:hypothetical protein
MPKLTDISRIFISGPIAVLALFAFMPVQKSEASSTEKFDEFSRKCGVTQQMKIRIFAAHDGEHWKRYPSVSKIPEPNIDWSEAAFVARSGKLTAVEIDGAGQDFSDSSLYCFDSHGKLTGIEREFATAWGWGYAETDSFTDDTISSHKDRYCNTKTHSVIPQPAGYDDVHEAMQLKVYKSIEELPFFKLIRSAEN